MTLRARILILNYNGKELLKKYLHSFVIAAGRSKTPCRVGVIDNQSKDGSVEYLKAYFPNVDVYPMNENRVLCAYNEVARALDEEIVIFMNNDIRADEDFVDALVEPFRKDPSMFFVTPKCLSMDGGYEGNKTRGFIRFGVFGASSHYPGYEREIDRPGPTFQGGFGAFDRQKFIELGGYDDLYLPGRLEDTDICFRAHQRKWRCLYEPQSVVYHEGGTSFHKAFGVRKTLVINWRNTFLFMWKNLSARTLLFKSFVWLPARLLHSLLFLRFEFLGGFIRALWQAPRALERRRQLKKQGRSAMVPDKRIFELA